MLLKMKKIDLKNIESILRVEISEDIKLFYSQYEFGDLGLKLCDEETILDFENILISQEIEIDERLFPILDNDNSDFAAIYLEGDLKGMICIIEHEEPDTSPKFLSLSTLNDSIKRTIENTEKDFIDFTELETELPLFGKLNLTSDLVEVKNDLYSKYQTSVIFENKKNIAFRILKFVDEGDYDFIKENLLKNEDMFVQEEAINTIKQKLKEDYLNDVFEILDEKRINPLLATAVMLRENKELKNSYWEKSFRTRFPEIASSYL